MTNAINQRTAIFMLSAEPLENEYMDEYSPRVYNPEPQSKQDFSVAPAWFPKEVADAETVEQLHHRWNRGDSVVLTAITAAVIVGLGCYIGWEVGAFLAFFGVKAVLTVSKHSQTRSSA